MAGTDTMKASQDQLIADFITESRREIAQVKVDAALGAKMAARGYGAAKLGEGEALGTGAQGRFDLRQQALGKREVASGRSATFDAEARAAANDLRETIRAAFPGKADRTALGVVGKLPKDGEAFVTTVRATIAAAKKAPYAATLSAMSYDAAGLAKVEAALARLTTARDEHAAAIREAVSATAGRDAAYRELRVWMTAFRRIRKLAERG